MGWSVGGLAVAMLLVGCEGVPDGGRCSSDDECSSRHCLANLCGGSSCRESPSVCEPGWLCVDYGRDPIFGIPHLACVMHCVDGGCPAQYACRETFCSYVGPSLQIVSTPAAPRAREPFVLTAVLTPEPSGTTFLWESHVTIGPPMQGSTIELSLEPGSYNIAVTANFGTRSEDTRSVQWTVNVCPLAGDRCVLQGDDLCCAGLRCETSTYVCQ